MIGIIFSMENTQSNCLAILYRLVPLIFLCCQVLARKSVKNSIFPQIVKKIEHFRKLSFFFCTFTIFSATIPEQKASDSSFESSLNLPDTISFNFWFSRFLARKSVKTLFSRVFLTFEQNLHNFQFFGDNFWLRWDFSTKIPPNDFSRDSTSDCRS